MIRIEEDNMIIFNGKNHMRYHFAREKWCIIENEKTKREKKEGLF